MMGDGHPVNAGSEYLASFHVSRGNQASHCPLEEPSPSRLPEAVSLPVSLAGEVLAEVA